MNKYLVLGLFLLFGISMMVNLYLLSSINQETQAKKRILELVEKRNNTVSMALETIYTDSINNAVNDWLEDGTSYE